MSALGTRKFNTTVTSIVEYPSLSNEEYFAQYGFEIEPLEVDVLDSKLTLTGLSCAYTSNGGQWVVSRWADGSYALLDPTSGICQNYAFTITSTANSTVDEWLAENTKAVATMILKAGTYRFNDVLTRLDFEQNINFTSTINIDGATVVIYWYAISPDNMDTTFVITFKSNKASIEGEEEEIVQEIESAYDSIALWQRPVDIPPPQIHTITKDTEVDDTFGIWYKANTDYDTVNSEEETPTITDLKGTSWVVYPQFDAPFYLGDFKVNYDFSYIDDGVTFDYRNMTRFVVGYDGSTMREGYIYISNGNDVKIFVGNNPNYDYPLYFTFNGGEDVSNTTLISWLNTNGKLTSSEEAPKKKFTRLYLGDTVAKSGKKVFKKLTTEPILQLTAPVISPYGYELIITDSSNLAETYSILVDGEHILDVVAKSSTAEGNNATDLSCSIECAIGDTVVVAIATRDTLTLSEGWNLISTSEANSNDTSSQLLSWAYKIAESTIETITVTQASAQRLYINMIALTGEAELVDNGYSYKDNEDDAIITVTKPSGLVLWSMTASTWKTTSPCPIWSASNNIDIIQLGTSTQSRLGLGYDTTEETSVTFTGASSSTMTVGCLSVIRG